MGTGIPLDLDLGSTPCQVGEPMKFLDACGWPTEIANHRLMQYIPIKLAIPIETKYESLQWLVDNLL